MPVQTMVNNAAMAGNVSTSAPTTVATDTASSAYFSESECSVAILALPRPKTFVDTAIRVVSRLCASQLLLHARHPGAE